MGKGRATVVLKRAEQRSGVDLVARTGQNAAAIVVAHIVTQRVNVKRVAANVDVSSRSGIIQNGVPERNATAPEAETADVAAAAGGRVAAERAVGDSQTPVAVVIRLVFVLVSAAA